MTQLYSQYTIVNRFTNPTKVQPVEVKLPGAIDADTLIGSTDKGQTSLFQKVRGASDDDATAYVGVLVPVDGERLTLREPEDGESLLSGIISDELTKERDAVCHLDTGYFDIELCRGTGKGEGASKWGIRHFQTKDERFDLLKSGNNAIGGFYGPFFTPENGLINPPEHVVADVQLVESGPIMHRYLLTGRIPDGLRPELQGKSFSIEFTFYWKVDFFDRVYHVDTFETEVDGRSVSNRITVGDEFESGEGNLVFNRFDSYQPVPFRGGDPYAGFLKDEVQSVLADEAETTPRFDYFRTLLNRDLENAHWDLYWRLFSHWEGALTVTGLDARLGHVRSLAHRAADDNSRPWQFPETAVDVSGQDEETIFPGASACTAEYDTETGRCMIWITSQPSGAFQIVQRPQSGWVNWGTNGENECPALPVGSRIRTIYGPYGDNWRSRADESRFDIIRVERMRKHILCWWFGALGVPNHQRIPLHKFESRILSRCRKALIYLRFPAVLLVFHGIWCLLRGGYCARTAVSLRLGTG
ncbi:hypothetical protein BREU_2152 [Bifidobacterium reuteri DSM 23975]|uniref:Uncharacterized protein n=2 Tax=Bifidobacterium reuteri TaxID=983706 RepID=A0A087CF43_9BIFI|nr:hypothetical protein BREU_2152 [Bifidobacterium reuteri DSM 23975]